MHSTKDYQIKLSKDDENLVFFFPLFCETSMENKLPFLDSQKRPLFPNEAAPSSD